MIEEKTKCPHCDGKGFKLVKIIIWVGEQRCGWCAGTGQILAKPSLEDKARVREQRMASCGERPTFADVTFDLTVKNRWSMFVAAFLPKKRVTLRFASPTVTTERIAASAEMCHKPGGQTP